MRDADRDMLRAEVERLRSLVNKRTRALAQIAYHELQDDEVAEAMRQIARRELRGADREGVD